MTDRSTQIGYFLAWMLGIKLQPPEPRGEDVTRGESVSSTWSTHPFIEEQPRTAEWIRNTLPSGEVLTDYVLSLFPFLNWIRFYNLTWFAGDLVAGITIGAVVVPQGMAYAGLAELEPQFGLYSSFMGVLLYWFFATSKDISIGPVAVMSLVTGNVVTKIGQEYPQYEPHVVASCLSVIAGGIVLAIGLLRCGWIVDMISLTALSAFMTGSALTIAVGQIPTVMGISEVSTRDAPYLVFIDTLKNLGHTKLDAAMGLTALTLLYSVRYICTHAAKRYPKHQRIIFFVNTMRTVCVILLYTMISWLVNMHHRHSPRFKILGTVPRGFQNAAVPYIDSALVGAIASELPATVIVLLIEHIAISKSFGRVNNYTINPSQEMVAIGVTNILGPFLGAYPATGSFSRTAIKSKAGVRTPFAGVVTAVVVLLALYALPAVFFYIPNASLAAVIIHAVGDLITPPNTVYQFWRVSPPEVLIFFLGVLVAVFSSIENGIYCTVTISAGMLLSRILKARGSFLGQVKVHSVLGGHVIGDDHRHVMGEYGTFPARGAAATRNVFLPIGHHDGSNPDVGLTNPYPGIFIYRFSEGFSYPSASHTLEYLTTYVFAHSRRTSPVHYDKKGDRPWNETGPSQASKRQQQRHPLPTLKAVVLDFSAVDNIDVTSVQQLVDVRNQLDRHAAPDVVHWHLACIGNRWTKRALVSAGFGYPAERAVGLYPRWRWRSIFSVAEIGGCESVAAAPAVEEEEEEEEEEAGQVTRQQPDDVEADAGRGRGHDSSASDETADKSLCEGSGMDAARRGKRPVVVHGLNRPLFHVDLTSAVQSAIANVEAEHEAERMPSRA